MVDGGVGLDEVDIGTGVDVASHGRDDAAGDGAAEAEGVADSDHVLADAHAVAVAEPELRQIIGIDLEQREVGLLVCPDHFGIELAVIGEAHLHRLGVLDHVIVGHDVAVRVHDEARAERHAIVAVFRSALVGCRHAAFGQAEAAEELVEGRALSEGRALAADHLCLVVLPGGEDRHHGRAGPLDQVGDDDRRLGHGLRRRSLGRTFGSGQRRPRHPGAGRGRQRGGAEQRRNARHE